jgi:Rad3-related DNA helicase
VNVTETSPLPAIMRHFVLSKAREKQTTALEYIERKFDEGYRNIVIAAPTGIGKSAIGATSCFWSTGLEVPGDNGGYYLVTQKMLQDQLQRDIPAYQMQNAARKCCSLKSATEYKCVRHGTCAHGMNAKHKCACLREGTCPYVLARNSWERATMAVTNYPYLFTEHQFVGKLLPRKVLVLDECHSLERQILKFVEVSITQEVLRKWTPTIKQVPHFDNVVDFAGFLLTEYLPIIKRRIESLADWEPSMDSPEDRKIAQEKLDLDSHYSRAAKGAQHIKENPDNWVFWQEKDRRGDMEAMAKPLDASPFAEKLVL